MPIGLFQTLLGALGILFAFSLGRSAARLRRGEVRKGVTIGWALRSTVCVYAVFFFGGLRWPFLLTLGLAAVALAAGVWMESRPRRSEDLTEIIFPKE